LFFESDSVSFTASAVDNEDGNLSSAIQWSSNIDGALGSGASISVTLSGGAHIVSATVTDSQSATVISTVSVSSDGLPGDINDDGQVTVSDLLLLQQHLLNEALITDAYSIHRGDLYPLTGGDDVLDLSDRLQLEQLLTAP
jgi:dockerin type I repeat protein